jgi:HPt (histidine-containing phosphotransfer) domain-containing protein
MLDLSKEQPPEEFLIPYLEEFLQRRVQELGQMRQANTSSDFPSIKKIAHNWAGVCAPYGFGALAEAAREIERLAEERNESQVSELLLEISDYLERKKSHL